MSIDLNVLRNDLVAHKVSLNRHTENDLLGFYISLNGEDAYVKKVKEYRKDISQLEAFLDISNPEHFQEALNEAFKVTNLKLDADKIIQNGLSKPELIKMITDLSSKLKDHKIYLDKIILTSDK
ncbi:hypothetical protein ACF8D3_13610 [Acinetobacter sp. YQ_14]|uniref:hypothetical protein n=1 Tax=Acinetobacter sp. YQ_14 TaxID=3367236 RepID=UPI00370CDF90